MIKVIKITKADFYESQTGFKLKKNTLQNEFTYGNCLFKEPYSFLFEGPSQTQGFNWFMGVPQTQGFKDHPKLKVLTSLWGFPKKVDNFN